MLERISAGVDMGEQLTPKQVFCAPLLSAMLFSGGSAGIADIYTHIRDIIPLNGRDWESNPVERRLARWHSSLAGVIGHFIRIGVLRENGAAKWTLTDKGVAVARDFQILNIDGVLIERVLLRKRLDELALQFEKIWIVNSRPNSRTTPPDGSGT